jgi:transcriptional regulator with XRE-family HTH domain
MRQTVTLACAKLGERLFEARDRAGLTLRELGQRACISWSSISAIEKGKQSATAETIERLAVALGVRPCWLAFGEGSERIRRRMKTPSARETRKPEDSSLLKAQPDRRE